MIDQCILQINERVSRNEQQVKILSFLYLTAVTEDAVTKWGVHRHRHPCPVVPTVPHRHESRLSLPLTQGDIEASA